MSTWRATVIASARWLKGSMHGREAIQGSNIIQSEKAHNDARQGGAV